MQYLMSGMHRANGGTREIVVKPALGLIDTGIFEWDPGSEETIPSNVQCLDIGGKSKNVLTMSKLKPKTTCELICQLLFLVVFDIG